jgi:osmotically-inducible protein OsmY
MIRKTTALIAGVGAALGAGVMYLLDPDKGRRRRSVLGDKVNKARHSAQDAVTRTARDAANRTRGLVHEQKKRRSQEEVPDDVLVSRVRSEMGHVVERPSEVTVTALGGRVTLSGTVRDEEIEALTKHVAKLPGVAGVENRLNAAQTTDRPGVN